VPADNFTVSYYDTVYLLKSIIEKVGCNKPAIRDALAATKDWKGMLISYQAMDKAILHIHSASIATRARRLN